MHVVQSFAMQSHIQLPYKTLYMGRPESCTHNIMSVRKPTLVNITEELLPTNTPLPVWVNIVITEGCELGISEIGETKGTQTLRERRGRDECKLHL